MCAGRSGQLLAQRAVLAVDRCADVGLHQRATVGDEGVKARDLQRGHLEITLTNRLQHGVTRRPAIVDAIVTEAPLLVRVIRHVARRVAADVDPRLRTETEALGPEGLRLEIARLRRRVVQALTELVKIRVAGCGEGLDHVHRLVDTRLEIAVDLAVDQHLRRALDLAVRPDQPGGAGSERGDGLERRASRIEPVQRTVEERRVLAVAGQLVPVLLSLRAGEGRRIETWIGSHSSDRTGVGVHRDDRAAVGSRVSVGTRVRDRLAQRILCGALDARIDGEADVVPRLGRARTDDRADGVAKRIDAPLERTVGATQIPVEVLLHPALADDIARGRVAVRDLVLDLFRRDLTEFAPEMRRHREKVAVLPADRTVRARRAFDNADARELTGALLEVEEHIAINILGDHDRIEGRLDRSRVNVVFDLCDRHADDPCEFLQLRVRLGATSPGAHRLAAGKLFVDGLEARGATRLRQAVGLLDGGADTPSALIGGAAIGRPLHVAPTRRQEVGKARRVNRHGV